MSRLKEMYESEIKDAMVKKFGYKNVMEIPKLDKIVVNMGVGAGFRKPPAVCHPWSCLWGTESATTKIR